MVRSSSDIAATINDLFDRHGRCRSPPTSAIACSAPSIETSALAAGSYAASASAAAGIGVAAATGQRPLILVGDGTFRWPLETRQLPRTASIQSWYCSTTKLEMLRVFRRERASTASDWRFTALGPFVGGHRQTGRARREARGRWACAAHGVGDFRWSRWCGERLAYARFVSASRPPRDQQAMMAPGAAVSLEPLLAAPLSTQVHAFAAMAAFALGAVQLAAAQGTCPIAPSAGSGSR